MSEDKKVPGGIYRLPEKDDTNTEDCSQCFYTGVEPDKKSQDGDCNQCFYQEPTTEEKKKAAEDDCSQCFYKPKH